MYPRKGPPDLLFLELQHNKQLDQDKVVWDRQQYQPNAIICQGDGPIAQFRRYYAKASRQPGITGENLLVTGGETMI